MELIVGVAVGCIVTLLAVGLCAWSLTKFQRLLFFGMIGGFRTQSIEWQRLCRQALTNTPEREADRRDDETERTAAANPPGKVSALPQPQPQGDFHPFDLDHIDSIDK